MTRRAEMSSSGPTRRAVLTGAGGLIAVATSGLVIGGQVASGAPATAGGSAVPPLRFFTDAEAATVEAMAERVFPEDGSPGARDAGVMHYIDGRLAGGWGRGERMYLRGPFEEPGHGGHGYQLPLTPREVYRRALRTIDDHCQKTYGDRTFVELPAAKQDETLTALEGGEVDLRLADGRSGYTSASFFAMFLENVREGLFSDPMHDGNRGMVGWKWVGFPGDPSAYGEPYAEYVGKWHLPYHVVPKGVR
ncbi:gluconate 2-dehydrogenase subunit 3 family protein [Actinophytocola gossypii]|uniref:Gluconate 2-dehydrogenase subunit 3 family protein n=1 Tax=Actinophytocola gossypii TaxID=2812003 RepID=A0ABT2JAP8_9PSEU|nr:gluconate 2-dehydrogenase subunit 3 family protein [Actinophytocola gossypii]MCT2584530.1 gluconate 2-dehydrogenase subunit 3 family protein [Actinophytocola gossypii]